MSATLLALVLAADPSPPILPQRPAVSATQVVFSYAGDLWVVPRAGGDARRLTAGVGLESYPVFSPDGATVAFAGEYEGNLDVYTVPVGGGIPHRVTHHPDPDAPVGWTADGKTILFRSGRSSHARFLKLFRVPAAGGQPAELPLPMAETGSLSPDGTKIAYVPLSNMPQFPGAYRPVRNYRGGTAAALWIADLADSSVVKVPRTDSNDFNPMWVGDTVYFLSDRDGATSLYATDAKGEKVRRLLDPSGTGIKSASAGTDAIVFERFGSLHLYDLKAGKSAPVPVRVAADLPGVRPRVEKVAKSITGVGLSPTGARAVFEARGEILTVPAEKGDVRNLTNSPGAADRDPSWSPDGKTIASFSDRSGEYELVLRPHDGRGEVKRVKLSDTPSFFYHPRWSPDGKKIAYADKRLNLWYVDLASGKSTKVDTAPTDDGPMTAAWSPDSKWLAYTRVLKSYLSGVFLHSLESGKSTQVTDGDGQPGHARPEAVGHGQEVRPEQLLRPRLEPPGEQRPDGREQVAELGPRHVQGVGQPGEAGQHAGAEQVVVVQDHGVADRRQRLGEVGGERLLRQPPLGGQRGHQVGQLAGQPLLRVVQLLGGGQPLGQRLDVLGQPVQLVRGERPAVGLPHHPRQPVGHDRVSSPAVSRRTMTAWPTRSATSLGTPASRSGRPTRNRLASAPRVGQSVWTQSSSCWA